MLQGILVSKVFRVILASKGKLVILVLLDLQANKVKLVYKEARVQQVILDWLEP